MQGQLFTQDFLHCGIVQTPPFQAFDDASFARFRAALKAIFHPLNVDSIRNEAQTEQAVIEPVLAELGWGGLTTRQVNMSA